MKILPYTKTGGVLARIEKGSIPSLRPDSKGNLMIAWPDRNGEIFNLSPLQKEAILSALNNKITRPFIIRKNLCAAVIWFDKNKWFATVTQIKGKRTAHCDDLRNMRYVPGTSFHSFHDAVKHAREMISFWSNLGEKL